MAFLEKTDLLTVIRTYKLDQLADDDDGIIEAAISTSMGILVNVLEGLGYDANKAFAKTGDGRNQQLLMWAKHLTMYHLYERVPDEAVPERVVKNYTDTHEMLKRVADGRYPLSLERKTKEDGTTKTKFRWGGVPKRSH